MRAAQQEAAVSARRTGCDSPGIDSDDIEAAAEQISDSGQARSAEADDADVGSAVAVQRGQALPAGHDSVVVPRRPGHVDADGADHADDGIRRPIPMVYDSGTRHFRL